MFTESMTNMEMYEEWYRDAEEREAFFSKQRARLWKMCKSYSKFPFLFTTETFTTKSNNQYFGMFIVYSKNGWRNQSSGLGEFALINTSRGVCSLAMAGGYGSNGQYRSTLAMYTGHFFSRYSSRFLDSYLKRDGMFVTTFVNPLLEFHTRNYIVLSANEQQCSDEKQNQFAACRDGVMLGVAVRKNADDAVLTKWKTFITYDMLKGMQPELAYNLQIGLNYQQILFENNPLSPIYRAYRKKINEMWGKIDTEKFWKIYRDYHNKD